MGFASRRSPPIFRESRSPNIWDSRQKDHPLLSEWVSLLRRDWFQQKPFFFSRTTLLMGSPFINGFASISKRLLASEATRRFLRLPKCSVERETPIQKGSLASPSHHGRLRLQVDNVHNQLQANLEISKSDVLSLASTLKNRCSSLHIIFVDRRLLHIESPLLMLPTWSSSSNAAWIPNCEPLRLRRGESPHGAYSRLLRSASITALPSPPQ